MSLPINDLINAYIRHIDTTNQMNNSIMNILTRQERTLNELIEYFGIFPLLDERFRPTHENNNESENILNNVRRANGSRRRTTRQPPNPIQRPSNLHTYYRNQLNRTNGLNYSTNNVATNLSRGLQTNVANNLQTNIANNNRTRGILSNNTNRENRENTLNELLRSTIRNINLEQRITQPNELPNYSFFEQLLNPIQNTTANMFSRDLITRMNLARQTDPTNVDFLTPVIIRPTPQQILRAIRNIQYIDIIDPPNSRCPITVEEFNETDTVSQIIFCEHIFNSTALDTWFNENVRCPLCRYDIREYNNGSLRINSQNFYDEVVNTETPTSINTENENTEENTEENEEMTNDVFFNQNLLNYNSDINQPFTDLINTLNTQINTFNNIHGVTVDISYTHAIVYDDISNNIPNNLV